MSRTIRNHAKKIARSSQALNDLMAKDRHMLAGAQTSGKVMFMMNTLSNEPLSASVDALSSNMLDDREQLMARLSITYDGRYYHYTKFRYHRLADAVNYAKLQRTASFGADDGESLPPCDVKAPTEPQCQLMAALAITFQDGGYRLGAFRYDNVVDAVNYARLLSRRPATS